LRIANIHASCVVLARAGEPFGAPGDAGILILGASGSGKSDLALRLIGRGALLVADDRVEIFARDDGLWRGRRRILPA
jgi:HPr kinase/phosphorylase